MENIIGSIDVPAGVEAYNRGGEIGIINFISNLIQIATVIAGIIVFINIILAGYDYISGGQKGAESARERITYAVIGLVLIVVSYTIAGVIGLLIFGRADYILNPTISGPAGS